MKARMSWLCLFFLLLVSCRPAFSSVALLLEEPYGEFGYFNPTGHAAIYLSNVCAASSTKLRVCRPGEAGVVISRYHRVHGYDVLAVPLIPYLYAVERVELAPQRADPAIVATLRDSWRREHLESIAPDSDQKKSSYKDWPLLIGALYDRKIYAFEAESTSSQDEAFIETFNRRPNIDHFNIFYRNCADFARSVLDFYYPHSVRRSYTADLGMTTPKQIAKSLSRYGFKHEKLDFQVFVLPQVEGSIPRSKRVDGVVEAMLRKKYLIPLAFVHPYFAGAIAVTYLTGGRFNPGKGAVALERGEIADAMAANRQPVRLGPALGLGPSLVNEVPPLPLVLPALQGSEYPAVESGLDEALPAESSRLPGFQRTRAPWIQDWAPVQ